MNIITERLPLSEIAYHFSQSIKAKYDLDDGLDFDLIRKSYAASGFDFEEGEKSVVGYITTKAKDRDGEIVEPDGAILDQYKLHPVVLWCHDYKQLPVGKNLWIKKNDRGLIAKTMFANHLFAQTLYEYAKDGFPLGFSIGFVPMPGGLKYMPGIKTVYTKYMVLEYSIVPMPANQEALSLAVSKGILTAEKAKQFEIELFGNYEIIDLDSIDAKEKAMAKVTCPDCEKEFPFKPAEGTGYSVCPECSTKVTADGNAFKEQEEEDGKEQKEKGKKRTCKDCGKEFEIAEGEEEIEKCGTCSKKPQKKEGDADEAIDKRLDTAGHPSAFDIMNSVQSAIRGSSVLKLFPEITVGHPGDFFVSDIYPYNYPSGNAVVAVYAESVQKMFQVAYTYDDGVSAIGETVVPVAESYVAKSFKEFEPPEDTAEFDELVNDLEIANSRIKQFEDRIDELEDMEEEYTILKEGRIISNKNRSLISQCITALQNLLDATAKPDVEQKELDDIEIEEPESMEVSAEEVCKMVKEAVKSLKITESFEDAVARGMARVTGKVS